MERNYIIDMRSDTVTQPSEGMLRAMFQARTGDDVYGEDPSVNALEEKAAAMFGMEAGLFCPSGTMTNQIAIKALTQPGDEVICDRTAHIYNYEGGGIAFHSGASVRLLDGPFGIISPEEIQENINDATNVHFPRTSLVALENTCNKGGGSYFTLSQISGIKDVCDRNGLALHLDGARLFNALTATGESAAEYGKYFHTISLCMSKGMGAPVGSLLLGSREIITRSRRIRKLMGGGMRQAGYLAAACTYALDNNIPRLWEDHDRAARLHAALQELHWVSSLYPQHTNIVIFGLQDPKDVPVLVNYLKEKNILVSPFGKGMIRLVTHLDITDEMIEDTIKALQDWKK